GIGGIQREGAGRRPDVLECGLFGRTKRPIMPSQKPVVRVAPNNQVFDLPVIVAIEEGLFDKAGLDVSFSATHADREKDAVGRPIMTRLKEQLFDCGGADSYNVCEWASINRPRAGAPPRH